MTLKLIRGLWLWGMVMALGVLLVAPFAEGWRVVVAVLVTALVAQGWRRAGHRSGQLRKALLLADDLALPPAIYRQPVMLVCGDGLDALFPGGGDDERPRLRMTAHGCYLAVTDTRQLPTLVSALLARRPTWSGQLGVLFVANPGEHDDPTVQVCQARALAHQLALVRKQGRVLPLLLASYLRGEQADNWFVWGNGDGPQVHAAGTCSHLEHWQRQAADVGESGRRLRASVQLEAGAQWWREQVLPHLEGSLPVVAAMTFVEALPAERAGNLWAQRLRQKLALVTERGATPATATALAFPDVALPRLPLRLGATPRQRAVIKATWMFTLAGALALLSSAWNNDRLIRQVAADLQRYASIPLPGRIDQPAHGLREESLAELRRHADLLGYFSRHGEPIELGFGLYRDELLRERLLAVLLDHRQPLAPRPVVVKAPGTVRLDSLSLFSSGSALLKPESTKVLVNALVDIKAQPGWLIVIGGHTDATGSDEHNLRLSRARAAAVRDWMQRMGDIPDSCFAVQGFGASQPIASNEHADGRMSNRRVDIRLVPVQGACAPAASTPG